MGVHVFKTFWKDLWCCRHTTAIRLPSAFRVLLYPVLNIILQMQANVLRLAIEEWLWKPLWNLLATGFQPKALQVQASRVPVAAYWQTA
jgi:hypothetical protein